ncbi:MAG: hypothetical protein AAF281_15305, partial [Pseudomonadota bacterium]
MTAYATLALIPDCDAVVSNTDLTFVNVDGVAALLQPEKRPLIALPPSRKLALQQAAKRQALLEAVMPLGTVLPFRMGTYLAKEDIAPLIRA